MQYSVEAPSTKPTQHAFAGRHMFGSYFGCDGDFLSDAAKCLSALRVAADATGVTVLSENVHLFPNGAVTAVLLLAESHASIHTYPEHGSCFIDFFTCGMGNIDLFDATLRKHLQPSRVECQIVERGTVDDSVHQ